MGSKVSAGLRGSQNTRQISRFKLCSWDNGTTVPKCLLMLLPQWHRMSPCILSVTMKEVSVFYKPDQDVSVKFILEKPAYLSLSEVP